MTKQELRAYLRARRPDKHQRKAESEALCGHLTAWQAFRQARAVASFMPLPWEADLLPINALILGEKRLLLPKTDGNKLRFCQVDLLEACLPAPPFGVAEPPENAPERSPSDIELLLVPLEGIDRTGNRLGKGGGYYDRFLKDFSGQVCGIALRYQLLDAVPTAPWDQPLPFVATPDGIKRLMN